MNKLSLHSALVIAMFVIVLLFTGMTCANVVMAMGSKSSGDSNGSNTDLLDVQSPQSLQQSYVWYDGNRERTVWLNPRLVIEFNTASDTPAKLKSIYSAAEEIEVKLGMVRIWKLSENNQGITASRYLNKTENKTLNSSNYSPVLHDSSSDFGGKRALPGNVIVHLNQSWSVAEVDVWLVANNLQLVKKLNIGANIFVIKAAPGLFSLELANRLYNAGDVVAAYPDWWVERTTR